MFEDIEKIKTKLRKLSTDARFYKMIIKIHNHNKDKSKLQIARERLKVNSELITAYQKTLTQHNQMKKMYARLRGYEDQMIAIYGVK